MLVFCWQKRPSVKQTQRDKDTNKAATSKSNQLSLQGFEDKTNDAEKDSPTNTNFWADLFDTLPPWLDEIIAIALLIFGVLSFIALINPAEAIVATAWRDIMTGLFGRGSVLISVGLFILGIIILLPKVGVSVRFPPARIFAIEIAFLAIIALLHLLSPDTELRAIARIGEGGGQVGWGLSLLAQLLGRPLTIFFYACILFVSLLTIIGVRKAHIKHHLEKIGHQLQQIAEQNKVVAESAKGIPPIVEAPATIIAEGPFSLTRKRTPFMRIRANPEHIPPSLRVSSHTPVDAPKPTEGARAVLETPNSDIKDSPTFFGQRQLKRELNLIGEVKRKNKDGIQWVERPDGRLKRYFSVDNMRESKRVVKRDKDLPPIDLLDDIPLHVPDEQEINHNVVLIENTLLEFDIDIDVVDVQVGPTVTQYAIQPFREGKSGDYERTRVGKIAALAGDLALALSAKRLRLETPVPGQSYLGVEVPNKNPSIVALRSVYESKAFHDAAQKSNSPLLIPLGRDVSGKPVAVDIATMPHLLIAGTTGSGKSVCIAALATALVLHNTPEQVQLVMLDPKMVELSRFNGLPHLLGPVETDAERIIEVLRWCTREMDRRYKLLEEHAARNIDTYNSRQASRKRGGDPLPYIVIFIDEIGDLMLNYQEETEKSITRLAQMARAVGMHLVVATQRPSVDVITGLIKANFPTRISFAVASSVDSRVILDTTGAETLLGRGDMLYLANDAAGPRRIQGCFVSDEEVRRVVTYWREWHQEQIRAGKAQKITAGPWERGLTRREFLAETDPMLEEAIELVVQTGEASASMIQRRLGLGYPRAARIMDMLEELGIIGEPVGGGRNRRVLFQPGQDPFKKVIDRRHKASQMRNNE